jgi:hypothetical protein
MGTKGKSIKGERILDRGIVKVKTREGTINGKSYRAMSGGVHKFNVSTTEKTATGSLTKGKRRLSDNTTTKWQTRTRKGTTPGGRDYSATKYSNGASEVRVSGFSQTRSPQGDVLKQAYPPDYVRHKVKKGPTKPVEAKVKK